MFRLFSPFLLTRTHVLITRTSLINGSPAWMSSDAKDAPKMAYVMREDANKTRYSMARLPLKEAEAMVADLKKSGHKQTYWAEPDSGQTPPPPLPHRPPEQVGPKQNPIAAKD